jgi:hypothetical protein
MEVEFDERLRTGEIEMPGLPTGPNRIFTGLGWEVVSWSELPHSQDPYQSAFEFDFD